MGAAPRAAGAKGRCRRPPNKPIIKTYYDEKTVLPKQNVNHTNYGGFRKAAENTLPAFEMPAGAFKRRGYNKIYKRHLSFFRPKKADPRPAATTDLTGEYRQSKRIGASTYKNLCRCG